MSWPTRTAASMRPGTARHGAAGSGGWLGSPRGSVLVFVVTMLAAAIVLGSWAVSSPTGSSPDDDFHLPSIWCRSAAGVEQCQRVGPNGDRGEAKYLVPERYAVCFAFQDDVSGSCGLLAPEPARLSETLYPPLFYNYASLFAGQTLTASVVPIRLAVGASVLALFGVAYLVSLPWLRKPMIVSWAAGSMPLGVSLYASINPSAWVIAGVAAMWGPIVTAYLCTGRQRWSAVAVWVLAAVMAAGARGDGAVYAVALSGLALVLLWQRQRWPMLLATAGVTLVSAALFLPSGHAKTAVESFSDATEKFQADVVLWSVAESFPTLWAGLTGAPWGDGSTWYSPLGWFDVPMPAGVWMPITLVLGGLVSTGAQYWNLRKELAVAALLLLAIAVPGRALVQAGAVMGTLYSPRYMLPILLVAVGVLLVRVPRPLTLTLPTSTLVIMWVMLTYAGSIALHSYIRRYITGVEVRGVELTDPQWWSMTALSPTAVWLLGSVAWAVVLAVALAHLHQSARSAVEAPPQGAPNTR